MFSVNFLSLSWKMREVYLNVGLATFSSPESIFADISYIPFDAPSPQQVISIFKQLSN
jgi:hypothetical protein